MTQANPYAPPGAAVGDVDDEGEIGTQPVKLFSIQGRVGRMRMLAYFLGSYLLLIVAAAIGGFLGAVLHLDMLSVSILVIGALAYFVFIAMVTVQRSHDMDMNGWWTLAAVIPLVGLLWMFKAGTKGRNRYGAPPPPNTLMIKIGALFFPLIMVIGIVAAIALPAYQGYTMRAKARQQGMQAPQVQPAR